MGAMELISEQLRVLRRVFIWPALALQGATLLPLLASGAGGRAMPGFLLVSAALNIANMYLGMVALCWLSLWFGLKMRSHVAAAAAAACLVQGVPALLILVGGMIPIAPEVLILGFNAILLFSSRERLREVRGGRRAGCRPAGLTIGAEAVWTKGAAGRRRYPRRECFRF